MKKKKTYVDVRFKPEVIREATELLDSFLDEGKRKQYVTCYRSVDISRTESWMYDTDEEFFAALRRDYRDAEYYYFALPDFTIIFHFYSRDTTVSVAANSRQQVEAVFKILEMAEENCRLPALPEPPKPKPLYWTWA